MRITEKKLRNIIKNIVLENRLPGGEETTKLSKALRKKFPSGNFTVHKDIGLKMSLEQFGWVLFESEYKDKIFKVQAGSQGKVYVHFDLSESNEE